MEYVYKYTDLSDGIVKYVGITNNMAARVYQHTLDKLGKIKSWNIEYAEYPTRADVEFLEGHLISLYGTATYFNVAKSGFGKCSFDIGDIRWQRYEPGCSALIIPKKDCIQEESEKHLLEVDDVIMRMQRFDREYLIGPGEVAFSLDIEQATVDSLIKQTKNPIPHYKEHGVDVFLKSEVLSWYVRREEYRCKLTKSDKIRAYAKANRFAKEMIEFEKRIWTKQFYSEILALAKKGQCTYIKPLTEREYVEILKHNVFKLPLYDVEPSKGRGFVSELFNSFDFEIDNNNGHILTATWDNDESHYGVGIVDAFSIGARNGDFLVIDDVEFERVMNLIG